MHSNIFMYIIIFCVVPRQRYQIQNLGPISFEAKEPMAKIDSLFLSDVIQQSCRDGVATFFDDGPRKFETPTRRKEETKMKDQISFWHLKRIEVARISFLIRAIF